MRLILLLAIFGSLCFEMNASTHIVKRGDTLGTISKQYGTSIDSLLRANGIRDQNVVIIGQELEIPENSTSRQYVIRKGDNLASIADEFNVTLSNLVKVNRFKNPDRINVGDVILLPSESFTEISYRIKSGDTLASIASGHPVTAIELASHNGILRPDRIREGDVIRIPQRGSRNSSVRSQLNTGTLSELNRVRVNSGKWKHIVIHHSANTVDTPAKMDAYHRSRGMENGLAYHFVIGNGRDMGDGVIHVGNRWKEQIQGGHLKSSELNEIAIGICLVGDFTVNPPSAKQMEAVKLLTEYLMGKTRLPSSKVQTHKQIHPGGYTECPGSFPITSFRASLR